MLNETEILTTAEMRAIESEAMSSGRRSGTTLMERAGAAVAGQIRLRWPRPGRALILCGPGNNGGDGYVIARLLHQAGWQLRVLGTDNIPGPDAAQMKQRWRALGPILPLRRDMIEADPGFDLCVDAVFGTGLTRRPEGQIGAVLDLIAARNAAFQGRLVAVDCPSGLCLDSGAFPGLPRGASGLRACLTVAFDSPKPGHLLEQGPGCCGRLVIADIGLGDWRARRQARLTAIWPEFLVADPRFDDPGQDLGRWLTKQHAPSAHKFSHGHALIIAGGVGQGGAARLAARAALRVGAGLVSLAPPGAALAEHAGPPDALMRRPLDCAGDLRALLEDDRISALCLGPGCGVARAGHLLPVLRDCGRPYVLDADGLSALAGMGPQKLEGRAVLTPHAGEFARLFPDLAARLADSQGPVFSKLDAARMAAAQLKAVIVLKGPDTVIATPEGQGAVHSASDLPWLATAGSGDVLAGIITGLLARGLPPFQAAKTATRLHAAAARRFGPGLIADDLPCELAAVLREAALPAPANPFGNR